MDNVFIGQEIEKELRTQNRSVVWFASMLDCNRTTVYKIFGRESLDAELLLKISNILKRNFFSDYTRRLSI